MNTNTADAIQDIKNVRPRQVLLVGLGGVGSRTVDQILSVMPRKYAQYTKAILVDTDLNDLNERIFNVPVENRIALGANPDTGNAITVGEYIRNHPETMNWFVNGGHLHTIEKRNTAQGAKQVRMVSRIALTATNEFCGMQKKIEDMLQDMNKTDGTTLNQGLLVMVICSVAGGTGAGTVLQFPLYLEQALAKNFQAENIQMECSMLLPNLFSRAQDIENQDAARANAYAVIREFMSMNSGKLTRGDILPDCSFAQKDDNILPYGRILFFDDVSMSGDSLEADLDNVYVPKIANAINEYLFGPVNGKITSALDNTLARVYRTKGTSIFGSVGEAKLEFPRATYIQYVMGKWIEKVISNEWLDPDVETEEIFKAMKKNAIENDLQRPDKSEKMRAYCEVIESKINNKGNPFYKEIARKYFVFEGYGENEHPPLSEGKDLAEFFWDKYEEYLTEIVNNDPEIADIATDIDNNKNSKNFGLAKESLSRLKDVLEKIVSRSKQFEINAMYPIEAQREKFFSDDKDELHIYTFLKNRELHPIMLRYFFYKLYMIVDERSKYDSTIELNTESLSQLKRAKDIFHKANSEQNDMRDAGVAKLIKMFAEQMKYDLKEYYIREIEDMFKSIEYLSQIFGEKAERSINELVLNNSQTGTVLAGGPLSMMYTWKKVKNKMSEGDDLFTIDKDLNVKIHELIYKGFLQQVGSNSAIESHKNGLKIRVRTKYEEIIAEELQVYYSQLLSDGYSDCFPKNVIDAALLECGLTNSYKDEMSRSDSVRRFSKEIFMDRGTAPTYYAVDSENKPAEAVSNATYINNLLSATIGNSKPYCGRVDDNVGDAAIINRLMVVNNNLLRKKEDTHNVNEFGVAAQVEIKSELIDGVSTSRIKDNNINAQFVSSGISVDEICFVTTIAGLKPSNFVAFLPPDDDIHAPSQAKEYYTAYKDVINSIAISNECITPHLHRNWHLADMLEDLTEDHTNTYNREAAKAFVYGFVFDIIKVVNDGLVEIGEMHNQYFARVFGDIGVKTYKLLDPNIHASVDNELKISGNKGGHKRDLMNSIFVKIYELLATSDQIRDAIYGYATEKIEKFKLSKSLDFLTNCMTDEDVSKVTYNSILDVIEGYYLGTRQLDFNGLERGEINTEYMLTVVLQEVYNLCKCFGSSPAEIKQLYEGFVGQLYDDAFCSKTIKIEPKIKQTETKDLSEREQLLASSYKILESVQKKNSVVQEKPFAEGRFNENAAKDMIDYFIDSDK